jgi:hypothetical protein
MNIELIKEQVKLLGWTLLPAKSDISWPALIRAFGLPIPAQIGGKLVLDIRPYSRVDAPKSTMSAFVGYSTQPMHTDAAYYPLPPHYVILSCIHAGEAACPTQLWVLNWPDLLHDRPSVLTVPGWIAHGGRHSPFYCQVLSPTTNQDSFVRFDPLCMKPPSRCNSDLPRVVTEVLRYYSRQESFSWKTGETLIFDNWRCLHARGPGSERAPSRRLRRWMGGCNGLGL